MGKHPLIESVKNTIILIVAVIAMIATVSLFLSIYLNYNILIAIISALIFSLLQSLSAYYYYYFIKYIRPIQAHIVLTLLNQIIIISIIYLLTSLTALISDQSLIKSIPIYFTIGSLSWIILIQWYKTYNIPYNQEFNSYNKEEAARTDREINNPIDKISVKDGTQIHLIGIQDLFYIQAYGDYVILYTQDSKHIKEQTMKYLEEHLPCDFVRIHRSCIVNTNKITRAELYGKESYNIYLKNGACLKASNSGYKLLKNKLFL